MSVPAASIDLICDFEGYLKPLRDGTDRVKPYRCPANVPTIGFGTIRYPNGVRVTMGDKPITREQARAYMMHEIERICEPGVDKATTVALHALMRGAIVSFAFNCGVGAYQRSSLRKRVNARRWKDVPKEFAKWRMGGGRVLKGLVRRRAAEAAMFMEGVRRLQAGERSYVEETIMPPLPEQKPTPAKSNSWWQALVRIVWGA